MLVFILLTQNLFLWITFADDENCYVCSRMSNEMQAYVNFQVEIISQLRQIESRRDNYTWWTKKWLFSYGTVKVWQNIWSSMKQSMNKAGEGATDAVRSAEISSFILSKNATVLAAWEWFGDMLVLFRQKPFMRDRSTLQEIDSSLDDLAWDVWMQGYLFKKIPGDIVNWVNDVVAKYVVDESEDNQIFSKFIVNGNARYADVIADLSMLNLVMKDFFTTESIHVYKDRVNTFTNQKWWRLWLSYSFNDNYLLLLSQSYACVKWTKGMKSCGWTILDFASEITNVWVEVKQSFSTSIKEIKDSTINLAQATKSIWKVVKNKFSKDATELGLTDYQVELLSSVYWIDAYKLTQQQWFSISTLFNGKFLKNLKNSITISFDIFDSEMSAQKKASEKARSSSKCLDRSKTTISAQKRYCHRLLKGKWDASCGDKTRCEALLSKENLYKDADSYLEFYVPNWKTEAFTGLVEYLNFRIDNTLWEIERDEDVVMYSRNDSTTTYFVEIGSKIHHMIDNVIGSKDKSDSIVKNLWDACEKQCTNKWWECFYQYEWEWN